jgi:hypothetical protein
MTARNEVFVLWNLPKPDATELRRVVDDVRARARSSAARAAVEPARQGDGSARPKA